MCRYAYKNYKSHFACFECRKAFKKTSFEDYLKHKGYGVQFKRTTGLFVKSERKVAEKHNRELHEKYRAQYHEEVSKCPDCGGHMAAMGLDFRAPKKTDIEAWKIIGHLYDNGFWFAGCGCFVGYEPPSKLSELPSWLKEHGSRNKSEGEKLLQAIKARTRGIHVSGRP